MAAPLSSPAATNLTAEELKIEIAASTVNNVVVASLGAAIAVFVATTIGATVVASSSAAVGAAAGAAGAATGGAGGGAAGAAGCCGGGGAGGIADVATVLMAVQRLSVLASMPVGMSKMHTRVGETLAWTKGSLGLFPQIVSEETRQYWGWGDQPKNAGGERGVGAAGGAEASPEPGDNATTHNDAEAVQLLWHNALKALVDTLTTLACALAAVTSTTTTSPHRTRLPPTHLLGLSLSSLPTSCL